MGIIGPRPKKMALDLGPLSPIQCLDCGRTHSGVCTAFVVVDEEYERERREWEADMNLLEADPEFAASLGIERREPPRAVSGPQLPKAPVGGTAQSGNFPPRSQMSTPMPDPGFRTK